MTPTEAATPSAPTTPVQTPKQTAANIVKGIQEKANPVKAESTDTKPEAPKDPVDGEREKFVVNGKEVWLSKDQARAYVQKGLAFEPKVSELDRLQKETVAFLKTLKEDPARILFSDKFGATPHEVLGKIMGSTSVSDQTKEIVGKWYWENVVEPQQLSPEEREFREVKKKNAVYEAKEKEMNEQSAARENAYRVQVAMGELKMRVGEALKEFGMPSMDTPIGAQLAKRVADVMRLSHFQRTPITPKEAAMKVRSEMKSLSSMFLDELDDENLIKEIGEKNAERVKKYYLKLAKESEKHPTTTRQPSPRAGERKVINSDDFHDYLDELKKSNK